MCSDLSPRQALERAVDLAGGQADLGKRIGVKQQNVWSWINRSGKAPAEYALAIERAVEGKITAHQLRPDVFAADVAA